MASGDAVLVVVPSEGDCRLIVDCLSQEGIHVLPTTNLLDVLLHQVSLPVSVILYDTDAPEHWRKALQQFLVVRPATRVVFLSRLADERMWMEVLEGGGYDLVMKPLKPVEIRSVVQSALRRFNTTAA